MEERVLVPGAFGCIGAWVIRELVTEGAAVVGSSSIAVYDPPDRIRMLPP